MDLLKVFKILGDKDIRISVDECFVENLTINDIIYEEGDTDYYFLLEDTTISIPENLSFKKIDDYPGNYFAMLEWGGIIMISNVKVPLEVSQDEEIDLSELDIELDFDESDFFEEWIKRDNESFFFILQKKYLSYMYNFLKTFMMIRENSLYQSMVWGVLTFMWENCSIITIRIGNMGW